MSSHIYYDVSQPRYSGKASVSQADLVLVPGNGPLPETVMALINQ